jgi:hypothetical protein
MAAGAGLSRYVLAGLVSDGVLQHPMRGVYYGSQHADSLDLRVACLSLVMPPGFVVTDRSAGWLWGVPMILAPGDHRTPPRVSAFGTPGRRMRNSLADSGERRLARRDVQTVKGLTVTTPLRTACDLGRLLHRDQALGAIDALLAHGTFDLDQLLMEVSRFKRYRGVVQLRQLAPLADARAQSPQESILRLRWYDCGLPPPECQVEVPAPEGVPTSSMSDYPICASERSTTVPSSTTRMPVLTTSPGGAGSRAAWAGPWWSSGRPTSMAGSRMSTLV